MESTTTHQQGGNAMTNETATHTEPRELAVRKADGISVLLLWHPSEDNLTVTVADSKTGEVFELPVERHRAMEAFHHPFAYAA
jgi:hypothetical protein